MRQELTSGAHRTAAIVLSVVVPLSLAAIGVASAYYPQASCLLTQWWMLTTMAISAVISALLLLGNHRLVLETGRLARPTLDPALSTGRGAVNAHLSVLDQQVGPMCARASKELGAPSSIPQQQVVLGLTNRGNAPTQWVEVGVDFAASWGGKLRMREERLPCIIGAGQVKKIAVLAAYPGAEITIRSLRYGDDLVAYTAEVSGLGLKVPAAGELGRRR